MYRSTRATFDSVCVSEIADICPPACLIIYVLIETLTCLKHFEVPNACRDVSVVTAVLQ